MTIEDAAAAGLEARETVATSEDDQAAATWHDDPTAIYAAQDGFVDVVSGFEMMEWSE